MSNDAGRAAQGAPEAFPLVFTFKDLLAGRGFVVSVETWGRVVLAEEAEGWTIYGVNPGGVAGGGENRSAALADFRRSYQEVLDDIAHEARDFTAFKASAEAVLHQVNEDVAAEWTALRERVRAGDLTLEEMKRHEGEFVPHIDVRLVDIATPPAEEVAGIKTPSPALNSQDYYAEAA
jgi:hypothetical protein